MENFLIHFNLEEKEVMINPIIDISTILEKIERKIVYIPSHRRYYDIVPKKYAFPAYLPEIGTLISLDIVSKDLARRFYQETKDFEGIVSKGKIFISGVYNFHPEKNRMVSWGNIKSFNLPENIYSLYLSNLINDLLITPSVVRKWDIISPNRWFCLASRSYYEFYAILHYNIGIIYLHKRYLVKRKVKYIWVNSLFKIYEVKTGFIILQPNGYVKYVAPIPIHFFSDPLEIDFLSNKGDYFLCFLISFNPYVTSCEKADIKKGCINIVENLSELVFSSYDILPFLFPLIIKPSELSRLLFRFEVKKKIFFSLLKRLMKFGVEQNVELIKAYEKLLKRKNRALEIVESEDSFIVKIINPLVIPFLVKKFYYSDSSITKNYTKKLLCSSDIINKIEDLNERYPRKSEWISFDFRPLYGIGRFLKPRKEIMLKYIKLFQNFYNIQTKNSLI